MGLARESRSRGPDDWADKSARIPAVPPFRSLRPDLPACTVGNSPEGHDERPGTYPSRLGRAARIFGLASRNNQPRPQAVVLGRPPRGGRLREEAPVGGVDSV